MKHSKVRVAADINGNVIGVSQNNPEYGYVRVEQSVTQISEAGWLKPVKRSALIKGKVEDLAEAGFVEGHELSGKIIVRESLTAFNPENPDRDLKIAGATGVVCTIDDQPIYRQTFYTSNQEAYDDLITHDNTVEIREVQIAQKEITSLKSNTLRDLGRKLVAEQEEATL
jgi:hypothetical protein